jgi:Kef-type K+ transport system membrane component KefB
VIPVELSTFQQLAVLLAAAVAIGLVAALLKQPLIVAYILIGLAVGPSVVGWAAPAETLGVLAEFGVALLLFAVGLKLDPRLVRHLGPVALATGLGQLAFTIAFGFVIVRWLGYDVIAALYVAIALTFSSTIIIVKLLSDKREIDSLHGRIAMGFLIVQDIAVVLALMLLGASRELPGGGLAAAFGTVALKVAIAAVVVGAAMRFLVPVVTRRAAHSGELLLLFGIAWCTALAALGEMVGFTKEVGAFLAGFSLAATPFREAIASRIAGVRDFLLLFFFVELGMRLDLGTLGAELSAAVVLSLFVLIGNPLIVMVIMGYMGYRKRTSFLAGLTVAQISEFSIVFMAMGVALGHVGNDALALVTTVGIVTIAASTYMILYSGPLYARLERWLGPFERRVPFREARGALAPHGGEAPEVVVFGLGRYGAQIAARLTAAGRKVLGVDFDPEVVRGAHRLGFPVRFGDAGDPTLVESLPLESARWVVSTLPIADETAMLAAALRGHGYRGRLAAAARTEGDELVLRRVRPDRLLNPFEDAAGFAAELLD